MNNLPSQSLAGLHVELLSSMRRTGKSEATAGGCEAILI
jgi:hypothetical protein